ncbi:MAG: putative histone protein, partial [Promethearchaeota archaeon CR_4]
MPKGIGYGCASRMVNTTPVIAYVASRDPEARTRKGRGFSITEIKEAKISKILAKAMKIPVDTRRETSYPKNVELLKSLQKPEIKKKAKKPRKEKIKVPKKKKVKGAEVAEKTLGIPAKKAAKKVAKKVTKKVAKKATKAAKIA